MKIPKEVKDAGNSIASNLMDASIQSSLGGLGGSKLPNLTSKRF